MADDKAKDERVVDSEAGRPGSPEPENLMVEPLKGGHEIIDLPDDWSTDPQGEQTYPGAGESIPRRDPRGGGKGGRG